MSKTDRRYCKNRGISRTDFPINATFFYLKQKNKKKTDRCNNLAQNRFFFFFVVIYRFINNLNYPIRCILHSPQHPTNNSRSPDIITRQITFYFLFFAIIVDGCDIITARSPYCSIFEQII